MDIQMLEGSNPVEGGQGVGVPASVVEDKSVWGEVVVVVPGAVVATNLVQQLEGSHRAS